VLAPDVVHVNGFLFPAQLAELMLRTRRRPVFVVQHHAGGPDLGRRGFVQRLVTPLADGFLFTAAGLAEVWRRRGVLGKKPVFEVVEGSCDFAPLDRLEARTATGMEGSPAVLWVGRLHPRKDPMTALDGFRRALPQLPEATLTMAFGQAPLLSDVERFLGRAPEVAGHVRLVGRIAHDELPTWYSGADLFLTSSPDEGSNYALIEAMACGLLPVASDIPPHRLLTDGDKNGELFPPGDAEACAVGLIRAARRSGPAPRESVRRRFEEIASWPAIARQAEAAYTALLARRRRQAP
jgi:glycosyltransferase involved in cell wall biosynthesis